MANFVQTCDQTITGRNFNYGEALKIMQDETYLSASDFDEDFRFTRKHGRIIQDINEFPYNFDSIRPKRSAEHHLPLAVWTSGKINF